jgi:hypothetical protein
MKNYLPKVDIYNKNTSAYYDYLLKAYSPEEVDKHWQRQYGGLYDFEIFTAEDLKKIRAWAKKILYARKKHKKRYFTGQL